MKKKKLKEPMKDFIKNILINEFNSTVNFEPDVFFDKSYLLKYLNKKMGAVCKDSTSRRNLGNIYSIFALLHYYSNDFYEKPDEYREFDGYQFSTLMIFINKLYGGSRLQNHSLNMRTETEFNNKVASKKDAKLIVSNDGRYLLHIDYLYVDGMDISKIAILVIEEFIGLLISIDTKLKADIDELTKMNSINEKRIKIYELVDEQSDARVFEIVSYAILKSHYKNVKVFFGLSRNELEEQSLMLYKTGRTNANDGGIDFVMKPLGRFFQVTRVNNYNKYLLDVQKVMHFPITFVIKTFKQKEIVQAEINEYIEQKSGGMKIVRERYRNTIEEIITINELKIWLNVLSDQSIDELLLDIDKYYRLELSLPESE